MKILAINSTARPQGTTTQLTQSALEGAASAGAETEMILLRDCNILYCRNCLTCYRDTEPEIGSCALDDDVTGILEKIRDADGLLLSSPVHCGFVSSLMVVFMERATWRLGRPKAEMIGSAFGGCPEPRLTSKTRAVATIVSAGGMPQKLRKFCDTATPWLQEQGALLANGMPIGGIYAGAFFTRKPEGSDWTRVYSLRKLTDHQLKEARNLGVKMVETIRQGRVERYRLVIPGGRLTEMGLHVYARLFGLAETVETGQRRDLHPLMSLYPSGRWRRSAFRSPILLWRMGLAPLLGRVWLLLTTRGRRTGEPRRALLEYHRLGDRTYVPSGFGSASQWFKNIVADPLVTVQTHEGEWSARGSRVVDADEMRSVLELILRRNPLLLRAYLRAAGMDAERLEEAVARRDELVMVRLERTRETTPPPMREDLRWVTALAGGALGGLLLGRLVNALRKKPK